MAEVIQRIGPLPLRPRRESPFQSLAHAIIHQQLSGTAAGTILRRFVGLSRGGDFPTPEDILAASAETLRSVGLSRPKVAYMQGLARAALAGEIPTLRACGRMTDHELKERLTALKGIGPWTVEMFLIFNLGRPDVLPVLDLGVRRGFQVAYGKRKMPDPDQLDRYGRRWMPHRTLAALYLWKVSDLRQPGNDQSQWD